MLKYRGTIRLITLWLLLFIFSCAIPTTKTDSFYSLPAVSYLREGPNYDSQVITELYNADQVKLLEQNPNGWWRVQSLRNQKIGWTQRDLLSEAPVIAKHYYITVDGLPLRDAPNEDVTSRNLLSYGDVVQKIAEKDGWWRVLVAQDQAIGWIPATMASETVPEKPGPNVAKGNESEKAARGSSHPPSPAKPDYYFVATETLNLHIIPLTTSQVVKVLILNNKVEKISQQGSDWFKIRYLDTGAEGWAPARCLKLSPVTKKSQIVTPNKKSRKKVPLHKQPESKILEPEGM